MDWGGKKTAAAVHQEITRELDTLLPRIFAEQRKTCDLDIEAVEWALRTALHAAGAAGVTELRSQPGSVPTSVPCACGGHARYKDMRLKPLLTVLGSRLKRLGMFWTVRGANTVIALRCCRHSRRFDDYWEDRRG